MFKNFGNLFIGLFVILGLVSSCKTTKDGVANKKQETVESYDLENSLLWKIEGKQLTKPSYLFGTIHLISADKFFWPKGALSALDESEDVVFEIDLDDMFDMGAQMGLLTKAFMKDNKTLADFYSEEDYNLVEAHFEKMGIPMFLMKKIKPMFLTVFASGDVKMGEGFGNDSSTKSYEMELYSIAQEAKKDVDGLESIEYQLSVFDSIPYQEQADMLLQTIKVGDTGDDAFAEMVQMYVDQDINKMVASMSEEEGISGHEDLLLYNRNRNWIPVMAKKMMTAQTFFAVGAGHLGGKDGVVDLLKKEGYKLTPLSKAVN